MYYIHAIYYCLQSYKQTNIRFLIYEVLYIIFISLDVWDMYLFYIISKWMLFKHGGFTYRSYQDYLQCLQFVCVVLTDSDIVGLC